MALNITRRQMLGLGASTIATLGLAACGGSNSGNGGDAPAPAADGDVKSLTFEPGKLTVATGNPAWEPWVMNDAPESGEGFEAALIYALADKMIVNQINSKRIGRDFDKYIPEAIIRHFQLTH